MFNSQVGLDIGSSHVRAVECVSNKKTRIGKITKAAEVQLPRGAVAAGEIHDTEAVSQALVMLWKEGRFSKTRICAGVSGENTLVRQVELPWEKPDLFRSALPLRLGNELPVEPFAVALDYYPIRERIFKSVLMQEALVAGALNATVMKIEKSTKAAKLLLRKVDYIPYALLRTSQSYRAAHPDIDASEEYDSESTEGQVIVNVGSNITEVIVHRGDLPLFIRTTVVGSDAVTKALSEKLGIPLPAADRLKEALGLQSLGQTVDLEQVLQETRVSPSLVRPSQQIINVMASALVQNVRDTVEYYLNLSNDVYAINHVSLMGGGSLLTGYQERLQGELNAPVHMVNPLHAFGVKQVQEDEKYYNGVDYCTAYGLAVKI